MARAGILLISFPIRIKKSLARPYNILMKMQGKSSIVHRFPKLLVLYFVRHLKLFVLNHSWRYKYDSRGDLIATTVVGCWSSTCTWSNQIKLGRLGTWLCFAMRWLFGLFVCCMSCMHRGVPLSCIDYVIEIKTDCCDTERASRALITYRAPDGAKKLTLARLRDVDDMCSVLFSVTLWCHSLVSL